MSDSACSSAAQTDVASVIVDTSGYASDCNFSDFMPQHAMKPYRILATMELIRALKIVQKANEAIKSEPATDAGSKTSSASPRLASRARRHGIKMPSKRNRSKWKPASSESVLLPEPGETAGPSPPIRCRLIVPPLLPIQELERVHALTYLGNLGLHNTASWAWTPNTSRAPFSPDCPPVEGIMEHSIATASGTMMGAVLLNARKTRVAIHWGGGMHHAKCGECSGFCYINDIVLGIIELLKVHQRVLYIDLDAHHGDGVDEAFCHSSRVFTLSLHKFGESYFPGTGHPRDCGWGEGKHYTMNLSLWDGITDFFYVSLFNAALETIHEHFKPDAIVLQCGADSLGGDRLGTFNLSSWGHGACVQRVYELGTPLLAVGGGGYTIRNVAKLWAYETAILCGVAHAFPPHTVVPIADMPLSGWLFQDQPQLLVAMDASFHQVAGWSVQRGYRTILDQIKAGGENLRRVVALQKVSPRGSEGVQKEKESAHSEEDIKLNSLEETASSTL